jgi:hypothetical protein
MNKTFCQPARNAGHWILHFFPDGVCSAYSPPRGVAFAIDEPVLMALSTVLEGVEPYTSRVWLEPIDEFERARSVMAVRHRRFRNESGRGGTDCFKNALDVAIILDRAKRASRDT